MAALSGCSLDGFRSIIGNLFIETPTAENTLLDLAALNKQIAEALKSGENELTVNIATSETELASINKNFDPFWGNCTQYRILSKWDDLKLSDDEGAKGVNVVRVTLELKPSTNYYVFNALTREDFTLPENETDAADMLDLLPTILAEIYPNGAAALGTAYEQTLAVHDWLVANVVYDLSIAQNSRDNGTYGALVNRRTMCQGYAEALQLLLLCATDVEVSMVVGEGNNGDGTWVGHAWNLVKMDGSWYHVDATFDDPVDNPEGNVNHFFFGQNDACMAANHRWNAANWPAAEGADLLYYRKSGLIATNMEEFKAIVGDRISTGATAINEIVVIGFNPSDEDYQFVFKLDPQIKNINRGMIDRGNSIFIIDLIFSYEAAA